MALTSAQLATLATDINGQASLATARAAHDAPFVANFYNAASAINVWRPDVTQAEIARSVLMSEFAALTAIKQNGLLLITQAPLIDATNANIRAAFTTIFTSGTSLTNLTAVAQRIGTRLEVLLVVSAGPPAVSQVFGYSLLPSEVSQAMGW